MWSSVLAADVSSPTPSARSKHSATLVGEHVYLLGGRNGNLPLKDFWKYNLVTGKWQQLKPNGDKLPSLQEHSAVAHKDNIYVFGGEVGFSAGTETPLWRYDISKNTWKKMRPRKETESWHLLSTLPSKSNVSDSFPPPRHKHSAIIHENAMWIYGGMTDLQERGDFWKWDIESKTWTNVRTKINPGPLHSHAACKLPSSMLVFGGERSGHQVNELWKFNFSVDCWERINVSGAKPQPRSETIAFTVSEFLLNDKSGSSLENKTVRIRARTCTSADRGSRHSSYLPNNRVAPCEKTYVFQPSQTNYNDGSDLAQEYSENKATRGFLQEISRLSQISRLNNKCSYSVLTGSNTDSTENLLKQHAVPTDQGSDEVINTELATYSDSSKFTMTKSKSAYVLKKKYPSDTSPTSPTPAENPKESANGNGKKRVEFEIGKKMTREPVSVPNFTILNLPTPTLTPVEAAKLVYLDTDDENDLNLDVQTSHKAAQVTSTSDSSGYENFNTVKRGESYSSHLGYADNPLYQHMMNSSSLKFRQGSNPAEHQDEHCVSSTSDYASIETVNRLSSASNYSVKTPQEENLKNKEKDKEGPFGFCNPNYMGPDIKALLEADKEKKNFAKCVANQYSSETTKFGSSEEDLLELHNLNGHFTKNTKVYYRHSARNRPPKFLALDNNTHSRESKNRALSASRVERMKVQQENINKDFDRVLDPYVPLYVYIIGGKEQGQVTVFQRPISMWKLKLF